LELTVVPNLDDLILKEDKAKKKRGERVYLARLSFNGKKKRQNQWEKCEHCREGGGSVQKKGWLDLSSIPKKQKKKSHEKRNWGRGRGPKRRDARWGPLHAKILGVTTN